MQPIAHTRSALIIDDHPLFCDALMLTLRSLAGFSRVECVHRLGDALALLGRGWQPDMVFLDLDLPDVEGLEGLLRLRANCVQPVLVVSSIIDERVVTAALAAGASGFVPKHAGREVFRAALDALEQGGIFLPDGFHPAGEASSKGDTALSRLSRLTPQQGRILELICQGKLNKQIAWELAIAETTVKAHVTAIMRKLGVQSRTQAVLMASQASFKALMPES
jgi:DNA-binding NarL/FixJ family response regulator